MRRLAVLVLSLSSLAVVNPPHHAIKPPAAPADRPHMLAAQSASQKVATCKNIQNQSECHHLADGCEPKPHPGYDPYLSFLKNQTIDPASADALKKRTFTKLADLVALDLAAKKLGLATNYQAAYASKLADLGQGEIDTVIGYLYYAVPTGKEACNCDLTQPSDTDVHIGIGFDPALAAKIFNGTFVVTTDPKSTDQAMQTSMIVEMTPHYRAAYHHAWTQTSMEALHGQRVKIVGQLLVDTDHNDPAQNCALAATKPQKASCWRGSVWELHPVTRLYVCKQGTTCDTENSPNWQEQP